VPKAEVLGHLRSKMLDYDEHTVGPNPEFGDVARAMDAVAQLQRFIREPSEAFDRWFREEHDGPPDLRKRAVWDEVIGW
jgi:hypothetical protein